MLELVNYGIAGYLLEGLIDITGKPNIRTVGLIAYRKIFNEA